MYYSYYFLFCVGVRDSSGGGFYHNKMAASQSGALFFLLISMITPSGCLAQDLLNATRDPFTDTTTSVITNMIMTSNGPEMSMMTTPQTRMASSMPNNGHGTTDHRDGPVPLYIMGLFPITGDNFQRGPSARIATQLALEHINDREDILPGYEVKINWIDTEVWVVILN